MFKGFQAFYYKLIERIPFNSVVVRCSSIFNPANLIVNELDNSKQKMKKLLKFLFENNVIL